MKYFKIGSNSDRLDILADDLFTNGRVCKSCGRPFDGNSLDIVTKTLPKGEAFAWSSDVLIPIINIELYNRLNPENFKHCSLGKLLDSHGNEFKDYLTINGKERFFVRGSKAPRLGPVCKLCNRFFAYTPQGGPLYILKGEMKNDLNLIWLSGISFLVNSTLMTKSEIKKFKDLVIEDSDVRVLEHAKDGYPDEMYSKIVLQ